MYEFERSVLSKEQLAQKTGKDMGSDVLGATGGECWYLLLVSLYSFVMVDSFVSPVMIDHLVSLFTVYPLFFFFLGRFGMSSCCR